MIDKALMIIIFCYIASGTLMAGQVVIGSVYDITLVNHEGVEISPYIGVFINEDEFNTRTQNIVEGNFTGNSTYYDRVETFTTGAAYVAWELITLMSGTYIFNVMYLMGVPAEFVLIFVLAYLSLFARAIIGYVRGI